MIKILAIASDKTGVGYFRTLRPHQKLQELYPNDFHVDIAFNSDPMKVEDLLKYDVIHFHKTISNYEQMPELIELLRKNNVVTIMDVDDYWAPDNRHPAYHIIKNNELHKKIPNNLKLVDAVTTTTEIFAKEISSRNKNVYVIPNAVDMGDAQFQPNPTDSDKLRIGWLGGSCFTPDTEILTDSGWKFFTDLDRTEKVATLNPETNELEYHYPNEYIGQEYDGDLYVADTNEVSFSVTGNHNMYVSIAKNLSHKKLNYELMTCERLYGNNFHVKKDMINPNPDVPTFNLPGLPYNKLDRNNYSEKDLDMDKWLMFFGFWLGDGWSDKNNKSVSIAQFKNNNYLETLYGVLEDLKFKPKWVRGNTMVRVCNKQLYSYLSKFGKADEKFIPRELLNTLSERQLNILLEWYLKADGSGEKTNKYVRKRGYTVSRQLADDLMELALKTGNAASIKNRGIRQSKSNYILENGERRLIKANHESLQIGFYNKTSRRNKLTPLVRSEKVNKTTYKGMVYCVNVKNNIIHVRRNGKSLWLGNSHEHDIKLLDGTVNMLNGKGIMNDLQFVLCGFDMRGHVTDINRETGQQFKRPILPHESVWTTYEKVFTSNYKTTSDEYNRYLHQYKELPYPGIVNQPYNRVWTRPVHEYAFNYNLFDVSLAPLVDNQFNRMKSQLKVIEAGFHKKALIASEVGPYTLDLTNAYERGGTINEDGNALLVPKGKDSKLWNKYIKMLHDSPDLVSMLSENLHNTVKDKYEITKVTHDRAQLYKDLVEKFNK